MQTSRIDSPAGDYRSQEEHPLRVRDDLRYIVIEGVIGVGKTTLAKLIAERIGAHLILEAFEENPFLPRFYQDRTRWGFQTQLSFLASRFKQQKALHERDLFHQIFVSDYSFDKDRIFAHQNLQGDELKLYESLYNLMEPVTPMPDLVVYLQSSPERLLHNIQIRGRSYEKDMDPGYIRALNEAYNYYFFRYTRSPLLIVNANNLDFVARPDDLSALLEQILSKKHLGMTYYNLIPNV